MKNILHIDASGRHSESISRDLSHQIVESLSDSTTSVTYRDVSQGLPYVDDRMIEAYFTAEEQRDDELRNAISLSNQITDELIDNDTLVIGIPIYNFSMPAAFKAWCDQAARVGVTFKYGDGGPVGLLQGKQAIVVITSGGTAMDSNIDFLTPWLRHYLGFIGIQDVRIIDATAMNKTTNTSESVYSMAQREIRGLTLHTAS